MILSYYKNIIYLLMLLSKNIKYQQYITDKANLQGIKAN